MISANPTVDVVIPAFNEERSLPLVLAHLPSDLIRHIVVADNASTDRTPRAARDGGAIVVHVPSPGYGSACLGALAHIRRESPPDIVVFLDADFSDHPDELPLVVRPILDGQADLVVGSRVLGRREPGSLLPQARAGNLVACTLIRLLYGHRYTDLGPFRAIRWSALERLQMRDRDFGWTAEMQVKALLADLRVTEVPVSYRRRVGVSKITGTLRGTVMAGFKILTTVLRYSRASMRPPIDRPLETVEIEVRYAETDQMGVVHHAVYPIWFELARTSLCATTGRHYSDIEESGFYLMVTGLETEFRRSARYGDRVEVDCWVERLSSRGVTFAYRVRLAAETLARGRTRHVWLRRADGRPCRTPPEMLDSFTRLSGRPVSIKNLGTAPR